MALQVDPLTTWIFGIITGAWLMVQFAFRREGDRGAELQLDVYLVGCQEGQRLIEIVATLANRGFVRHRYDKFRVDVRYLLPGDPIADGNPTLDHQLYFPHSIDARIQEAPRHFPNVDRIDPGLTFRHSYITFVPAEATFLLVHCSLEFPSAFGRKGARKNIQRLVRVGQ